MFLKKIGKKKFFAIRRKKAFFLDFYSQALLIKVPKAQAYNTYLDCSGYHEKTSFNNCFIAHWCKELVNIRSAVKGSNFRLSPLVSFSIIFVSRYSFNTSLATSMFVFVFSPSTFSRYMIETKTLCSYATALCRWHINATTVYSWHYTTTICNLQNT